MQRGRKGAFIVFEGIDGSGVTTHSKSLKNWLINEVGIEKVLWTKEPTHSSIGWLLISLMMRELDIEPLPHLMALLFAADRVYHIYDDPFSKTRSVRKNRGLARALLDGYIVISNRYILSALAYQGVELHPDSELAALFQEFAGSPSLDRRWIWEINRFAIRPDLVIYLDVPPDIALKRIEDRQNGYKRVEYIYDNSLHSVYERFKTVLEEMRRGEYWKPPPEIRVIQGLRDGKERTIDDVQAEVRRYVREFLERIGIL